jgi:hypothetical protein
MAPDRSATERDLGDCVPARARAWDTDDDGSVLILVPRYGDSRPGRWLARVLSRPDLRIRLDELGSAVWLACDGRVTVREIAGGIERRFGARVAPVAERLATFLEDLCRRGMIRLDEPDRSAVSKEAAASAFSASEQSPQ